MSLCTFIYDQSSAIVENDTNGFIDSCGKIVQNCSYVLIRDWNGARWILYNSPLLCVYVITHGLLYASQIIYLMLLIRVNQRLLLK